jgi:hypothetical protein
VGCPVGFGIEFITYLTLTLSVYGEGTGEVRGF